MRGLSRSDKISIASLIIASIALVASVVAPVGIAHWQATTTPDVVSYFRLTQTNRNASRLDVLCTGWLYNYGSAPIYDPQVIVNIFAFYGTIPQVTETAWNRTGIGWSERIDVIPQGESVEFNVTIHANLARLESLPPPVASSELDIVLRVRYHGPPTIFGETTFETPAQVFFNFA